MYIKINIIHNIFNILKHILKHILICYKSRFLVKKLTLKLYKEIITILGFIIVIYYKEENSSKSIYFYNIFFINFFINK